MSPLTTLILITTLVRLAFAWAIGLGVDESYMVSAGRVLSLGYFDHPPASWWLSWGAAHLLGTEAPVVVRLPFILLFALSTWLMARLGTAIAHERAGFWAAVLLNLSPVFGVTTGSWVLPDGPLDCALLGAALCLVHALQARPSLTAPSHVAPSPVAPSHVTVSSAAQSPVAQSPVAASHVAQSPVAPLHVAPSPIAPSPVAKVPVARGSSPLAWWIGTGLCAGVALASKYSAVLTIGGAFLYLATSPAHRRWLRRPEPYLAGVLALAVFSPVILWNATHGWASFAFQGERATGLRFRPFGPLTVLGGEALFVLPWIWLPMMLVAGRALCRGPAAWRPWLLCCLAAPPIVAFALIAAWSNQRILFHWAAPGYLMMFPLLGEAVAARLANRHVRRTLVGTAAVLLGVLGVIGTQERLDWLGPRLATVMRHDPTAEGVDWTSLRTDLAARGLLVPGTVVGVGNWRDAGKIAHALGPDVTVLCLNPDARQFGFAYPPTGFLGRDMLLLVVDHPEQVKRELAPLFAQLTALPPAPVTLEGRVLQQVTVLQATRFTHWPP